MAFSWIVLLFLSRSILPLGGQFCRSRSIVRKTFSVSAYCCCRTVLLSSRALLIKKWLNGCALVVRRSISWYWYFLVRYFPIFSSEQSFLLGMVSSFCILTSNIPNKMFLMPFLLSASNAGFANFSKFPKKSPNVGSYLASFYVNLTTFYVFLGEFSAE